LTAELDYLRGVKASMDTEHERALQDLAAAKDRELQATKTTIERLERTIEQLTRERDAASRAQVNAGDHQSRAQNLVDTLTSREKIITGLRLELVGEQLRVTHLEDEVEILKESSRKEDIDDLKAKLREKTSTCDKYRGQVKVLELHLKASQERVMKVANHGEYLPKPSIHAPSATLTTSSATATPYAVAALSATPRVLVGGARSSRSWVSATTRLAGSHTTLRAGSYCRPSVPSGRWKGGGCDG
jgi:hypothetical protein